MLSFLFMSSFLAFGLGGLLFWRQAIGRLRKGGEVLASQPVVSSPLGMIDVAIMFVLWIFGQLLSQQVAVRLLNIDVSTIESAGTVPLAQLSAIVATGQLIATAVGLLIIWIRYRTVNIFGWLPFNSVRDIGVGLIGFLMVVPAILVLQKLLTQFFEYHHATLDMLHDSHSWLMIGSAWFAAVLVAPICEEVFFRGILQSWLQRLVKMDPSSFDRAINGGWDALDSGAHKSANFVSDSENYSEADADINRLNSKDATNPFRTPASDESANIEPRIEHSVSAHPHLSWLPIVISATLFGLVHVGQGPAPIPLFLLGLALGYVYRQTGSILPCIVLHMGLNAFTMFWVTIPMFFPST